MGDKIIDPFNRLLNKISYKLTKENLQSLIHICGRNIPEGKKDSIQNGLVLFTYLQHKDLISHEKVGNLRKVMTKMLPQRIDIVRLVDDYIKKEYHTNDVKSVLQDYSDSYKQFNNPAFLCDDSQDTSRDLLTVENKYMYCGCRKLPSCYLFLIILFSSSIIATSIFWYADVPKINEDIKNDEDLENGGKFIIIAECSMLCLVMVCFLWKKLKSRWRGYVNFANPTVQEETGERIITNPNPSSEERVVSAPKAYNNNYGSASSPDSVVFNVGTSVSPAEAVVE